MKLNNYLKITLTYLLMFFALSTLGHPTAKSGFFDIETGQPAALAMSSLDLLVETSEDFSPDLSFGASSSKSLLLTNPGLFDYNLDIDANNFEPIEVCNSIRVVVQFDDLVLFDGNLLDFSLFNVGVPASKSREILIGAYLDEKISQASSSCKFELNFFAFDDTAFNDRESLNNTILIKNMGADHLLITKVYPDVDDCHGEEGKNEWWELFNPTGSTTEMKNWKICNKDNCRGINKKLSLPAGEKVFISHDSSTWKYYRGASSTSDNLGGKVFNMDRLDDMSVLINSEGVIVDQVNWGTRASNWENYNEDLWPTGIAPVEEGHVIGRADMYIDTDGPGDWVDLGKIECIDKVNCEKKDKEENDQDGRFREDLDINCEDGGDIDLNRNTAEI